jgi:hypothetical protein
MKKYIFDFRFILAAIILLIILLYLLPFKVEYTLKTYAKLQPARQWVISRGSDGIYISTLRDLTGGTGASYIVNQFERGASVEVKLSPELKTNQIVEPGDTLGSIYTSTNLERYTILKGELEVAKAELDVLMTGEKESVIDQAEHNLQLSKSELDKQAKIVERLKQLREKNMVSDEEYQLAADEMRSLNIAVGMRTAELQTVSTGAKNSEIQRLNVQIKTLKDQIKTVEKQMNSYNIIAPFRGRIDRYISIDTLLILSDTEKCLAFMPVGLDEKEYLLPDSRIDLTAGSKTYNAQILDINHKAEIVNNRQCVTLTAVFEGSEGVSYGMIVPAVIKGKMLSLFEYLLTRVNSEL